MTNINPPVQSLKSLILASVFALLLAVVILLSAVLPAEYGIDPTGMGKIMGLSALSAQTKLGNKALAITCPVLPTQTINQAAGATETIQKEPLPQWQDSVKIIVPAGEGLEYKFHLLK